MWKKQNRSTAPMTRPVKSLVERKRRLKVQKKRLVSLGVAEAVVNKLNSSQVREMLRLPANIARAKRKK